MKTGHKRLLKLADILRAVPRKQFDMNQWTKDESCGTVACAAGWACMDPGFRRAGLHLVETTNWCGTNLFPALTEADGYVEKNEWRALEKFFDLTPREAELLFMPGQARYDTPKCVADHIRKFVRQRYALPEYLRG